MTISTTTRAFLSSSLLQTMWRATFSQRLKVGCAVGKHWPVADHASALSTSAQSLSPVPEAERSGKSSYVDRIRIEVQAGNGGSGCVAFWKSAAKGGPTAKYGHGNSCKMHGLTCLAHQLQESFSPLMAVTEVMVATLWYKLLQCELAASVHSSLTMHPAPLGSSKQHQTVSEFGLDVSCCCVQRVKSMGGLRQLQRAQPGGQGGSQKRVGRHGADRVIQVSAFPGSTAAGTAPRTRFIGHLLLLHKIRTRP